MPGDRMDVLEYENTRLADYTSDRSSNRGGVDMPFLALTLILLTVGLIMVLSSSYAEAYYDIDDTTKSNAMYYFIRQAFFSAVGLCIMAIISKLPVSMFRRFSGVVMIIAIAALLVVAVTGTIGGGAQRWISVGSLTFQPSEIAKAAVILYFPSLICKYKNRMETFRYGILPFLIWAGGIVFLLYLEPHYSAIVIILVLTVVLMFVGGVRMRWFVLGAIGVGVAAFAVYNLVPYVQNRVTAWLNPFEDSGDTGWQVVQSLYAIGSGGLTGLGLGNSRQKFLYLPEEHNDYIFSIVCEELGYIGAVLIIILFLLLVLRGLWIARHAHDRYSFLTAVGISTLFMMQFAFNIAVCTNLIPSTGISLPLFSYGGTALLLQMAEIGVMLSISRDIKKDRGKKR